MTDIYFREDKVQYCGEEYFKTNLNEYMDVLSITKKYLNEELNEEDRPTEINFVNYPYLGNELFNDDRIASHELDASKEYYNQLIGVAIYIKDEQDQNLLLKDGFRDLRISYISIIKHYNIIGNALGAIHELNHFRDPFSSSINSATLFDEQDKKLFVQFKIRDLLNEYYATYRAYKYLKYILIFINLQELDFTWIFRQIMTQFNSSLMDFKKRLIILKDLEDNYDRFNRYFTTCCFFFDPIFRTLGKWHGLKSNWEDIDKIFIKLLEHFKNQLDKESYEFIINYLDSIKAILIPDFKNIGNIEELYDLFYHLAKRYPTILNSLK